MYRLLIVDDERLDREGLQKQLDWQKYGITETRTAKNAKEALRILETYPTELVFTDIKMPDMNGIELAKIIIERAPETAVIIVSGYGDFQYAKSALTLGAVGYILKPVHTEELVAVTQRAIDKLNQKKELIKKLQDLSRNRRDDSIEYDLLSAIKENALPKQVDAFVKRFRQEYGSQKCSVAAISIDDGAEKLKTPHGRQTLELVQQSLSEFTANRYKYIQVAYAPCVFIQLIIKENHSQLIDNYQGLMNAVYSQFGWNVTVALPSQSWTPEEVGQGVAAALALLEKKMFLGKRRLIVDQSVAKQSEQVYNRHEVKQLIDQLIYDVKKQKKEAWNQNINDLINTLISHPELHIKEIRSVYSTFVHQLKSVLREAGLSEADVFGAEDVLWDQFMMLETLQDILSWMQVVCLQASEAISNCDHSVTYQVTEKVKEYIEENFMRDLSLKTIAKQLFYSPNHLGTIFRKETGLGFNEYVLKYRMEKAADWLVNSASRINKIAEKVGYQSVNAFNIKFKQYFKVTPTQYRIGIRAKD